VTIDWTLIVSGILVLVIVIFIFRAVRQVKAKIERKLGPAPSEMAMKQLLDQIKSRELPKCPRCQNETLAMLETDSRYKCESCQFEFDGPPHF
jgi:transposase-like protein